RQRGGGRPIGRNSHRTPRNPRRQTRAAGEGVRMDDGRGGGRGDRSSVDLPRHSTPAHFVQGPRFVTIVAGVSSIRYRIWQLRILRTWARGARLEPGAVTIGTRRAP